MLGASYIQFEIQTISNFITQLNILLKIKFVQLSSNFLNYPIPFSVPTGAKK